MHSTTFSNRLSHAARRRLATPIIGGAVWLATAAAIHPELAAAILLLAPCAIVPMAIAITRKPPVLTQRRLGSPVVFGAWVLATLALCASFIFERGAVAGLLAMPWFAATLALAACGAATLLPRTSRSAAELAAAAAFILVAVGGGWTFLSRLGIRPLGFSDEIVLLTGVHFHYAGFALPILAARAAPALGKKIERITLTIVVAGVPLVGAGIAFSPLLEVAASWLLVAGCCLVAWATLRSAARCDSPSAALLLAISGMSLAAAMALAAIYATGEYCGQRWLDIPTMIPLHGVANAIGFALCGLLGWRIVDHRNHQSTRRRARSR